MTFLGDRRLLENDVHFRRTVLFGDLFLSEWAEDALGTRFSATVAHYLTRLSGTANLLRMASVASCTSANIIRHYWDPRNSSFRGDFGSNAGFPNLYIPR